MRQEFSKKVKLAAWQRCKGNCESCGARLSTGQFEYDHGLPAEFDGVATLENCVVLCKTCHSLKTGQQDIPAIAKSNRVRNRHLGIKPKRRSFATNRDGAFKKRMDGTVVRR